MIILWPYGSCRIAEGKQHLNKAFIKAFLGNYGFSAQHIKLVCIKAFRSLIIIIIIMNYHELTCSGVHPPFIVRKNITIFNFWQLMDKNNTKPQER